MFAPRNVQTSLPSPDHHRNRRTDDRHQGGVRQRGRDLRCLGQQTSPTRWETMLLIIAEKGFINIVVELLKHSDKESLARKNKSGFDALHVTSKEGHGGEH